MINRNSYIPLYIQLKNEIRSKIKSNEYNVEELIPSEKELMELYSVGRATVREAVNHLVAEGRLEKRQGIGTFVKKPKKAIGFEPLISLTHSLKNTDVDLINKVIYKEIIDLSKEEQKLTKMKTEKSFRFKRIRTINQIPIILEDFYFDLEFYRKAKDADLEESIGALLIEKMDIEISKIEQEVITKTATEEEQKALGIDSDESVLYMKRWTYIKNIDQPYQYYELVAPVTLSGYPFKHF